MLLLHNYDVLLLSYYIIIRLFQLTQFILFQFYYINSYYDARYSKAEKFI